MSAALPALLDFLRSRGSLKRAYQPLRQELPEWIYRTAAAGGHELVLAAIAQLLAMAEEHLAGAAPSEWPGASAMAYCALLLDAASQLSTPCTAAHADEARSLSGRHPRFFRKLCAVYGGGDAGNRHATSEAALVAARTLWARGDAGEVAHLIAEYSLYQAFDVLAVIDAVIDGNLPHAAVGLARTLPSLGVYLLEAYLRRHAARQAVRMLPRLNLPPSTLSPQLLRRLKIGLMAPRLRWLAHNRHWDLIDAFYRQAAFGVATAEPAEPAEPASTAGGDAIAGAVGAATGGPVAPELAIVHAAEAGAGVGTALDAAVAAGMGDAASVERLVSSTPLTAEDWVELAALLSHHLCGLGWRDVAVQGAVRHGLEPRLEGVLGTLSATERQAAVEVSEEAVATGAHHQQSVVRGTPALGPGNWDRSPPLTDDCDAAEDFEGGAEAEATASSPDGSSAAPVQYLALEVPTTRVLTISDGDGLRRMHRELTHPPTPPRARHHPSAAEAAARPLACGASLGGGDGGSGTEATKDGEGWTAALSDGGSIDAPGGDGAVGVLGIDVEWSDGDLLGDGVVQWIQLGSGTAVYLLDVPALTQPAHLGTLRSVLGALMSRPALLKVGFGLRQDLARLARCHEALAACAPDRVRPAVELGQLWQKQPRETMTASGGLAPRGRQAPGLTHIVRQALGQPLDKSMRLTNWARRPLVHPQLVYAALDAHCLVRVFCRWEHRRLLAAQAPAHGDVCPPVGARSTVCCVAALGTDTTEDAAAAPDGAAGAPPGPVRLTLVTGTSFAATLLGHGHG